MNLDNSFWEEGNSPVNENEIFYIEKKINVNFPQKFIELIKNCDGGIPLKTDFKYYDNDKQRLSHTGIDNFLYINFREKYYENILGLYESPPEFFPENLIAFADAGGGDFICFDYREGKNNSDPPIVYWSHGANIGKDVSFVAKNFEEFLSLLHEPDDKF